MKARVEFTVAFEYELRPENYPEGVTAEEMLAKDIAAFKDDHDMFHELADMSSNTQYRFTGELIK